MTEIPNGPIPDSSWVDPGRLLAGEYPAEPGEAETLAKLGLFRTAGIDFFLDLTEEGELPRYDVAKTCVKMP